MAASRRPVKSTEGVEVLASHSTEGRLVEQQLLNNSFPLPLQQQGCWPADSPGEHSLIVVIRTAGGHPKSAVGLRLYRSRSLPGHWIARVLKFGHGLDSSTIADLVVAAERAVRQLPNVLRLHLEVFSPDDRIRQSAAQAAEASGFSSSPSVRSYQNTLIVDLAGSDEELLARFHRMVRKNLRKTERLGHVVAPIYDPSLSNRLNDLVHQTMTRTGAKPIPVDWASRIEAAREHPEKFRVSGLFIDGKRDPQSLASFRWCGMQAGYADDLVAASARLSDAHSSVPLMHSVMWDMFSWARSCGASWFDFGGVVSEGDEYFEQLRSISEFKRLFSSNVRVVGADFELPVSPLASRVAGLASTIGNWVR